MQRINGVWLNDDMLKHMLFIVKNQKYLIYRSKIGKKENVSIYEAMYHRLNKIIDCWHLECHISETYLQELSQSRREQLENDLENCKWKSNL